MCEKAQDLHVRLSYAFMVSRVCTLVVLVVLVLASAGCERQQLPVSEAVQREDEPDQEVAGVDFTISNDGLARMRLLAPYMAEYEREDTVYTVLSTPPGIDSGRVQVLVYDATGALSATIHADRVVFGDSADRYDATGDVIVTTPTGRRLEGEHLAWYEASRKVKTPGFVKITTPSERIQGYNLDAEEDLSRYTLARITGQTTVQE